MAVGTPRHFTSRGKHLHHSIYYSKTRLPALKWLKPVLRSPASLIDYIASYKLSMLHKLCSSERSTPRRRPVATRTLRAPASAPSALTGIYLVNYAIRSPGLEKTPGKLAWRGKKFKTRCIFCACYTSLRRWHWFPVKNRYGRNGWQNLTVNASQTVSCVLLYLWNFLNLKICKSHSFSGVLPKQKKRSSVWPEKSCFCTVLNM